MKVLFSGLFLSVLLGSTLSSTSGYAMFKGLHYDLPAQNGDSGEDPYHPSFDNTVSDDEGSPLEAAFERLKTDLPPQEVVPFLKHPYQFRYSNAEPILKTLVELKSGKFFHGNHVRFSATQGESTKSRHLILTQAPLVERPHQSEDTRGDFWTMVYENKVPLVVNVASSKDIQKGSAARYWPTEPNDGETASEKLGSLKVIAEKRLSLMTGPLVTLVVRNLLVQPEDGGPAHPVILAHYPQWIDFKAPQVGILRELIEHLQKLVGPEETGPIVMHCSAGLGRAGVLASAFWILENPSIAWDQQRVDQLVLELRAQRSPTAVQTAEQLGLLYTIAGVQMEESASSVKE